jgi:riboflavin kinase/FMN adenylyltransferase
MKVVTGTDIYGKIIPASLVTIGNFDGVHRGHAEIFAHLKRKSISGDLPSVVVTFEPHPLKLLAPGSAPALLTTCRQKTALIEKAGIDWLIVVPFTREFSRLSAHDFVLKVLCTSLGMRHIIIGHDYAFGRERKGNFKTLETLGAQHGFTLEDLPPIGEAGVIFSSSLARSAVSDGDMVAASRILGRNYALSGTVVHGRNIGHNLGFPTANIATANELLPPDGVYAVMATVDDIRIKGACSIGSNPTFGGEIRTVEVFLLDFSGDVYGCDIAVEFVQKLRPVMKFTDAAALKGAIENDVEAARNILDNLTEDIQIQTQIGNVCSVK